MLFNAYNGKLPSKVPGARSRFDDFSATHIIASPYVYFSVPIIYLFFFFKPPPTLFKSSENKNKIKIGPIFPLPSLLSSPLRNRPPRRMQLHRHPTILGLDPLIPRPLPIHPFRWLPHIPRLQRLNHLIPTHPTNITTFGITLTLPPGIGGGCIYSGPFFNSTVNLVPVAFHSSGPEGGLGYNPRCLKMDISLEWSNNDTKPSHVVSVVEPGKGCGDDDDFGCFGTAIEAIPAVHVGQSFLANDAI